MKNEQEFFESCEITRNDPTDGGNYLVRRIVLNKTDQKLSLFVHDDTDSEDNKRNRLFVFGVFKNHNKSKDSSFTQIKWKVINRTQIDVLENLEAALTRLEKSWLISPGTCYQVKKVLSISRKPYDFFKGDSSNMRNNHERRETELKRPENLDLK